MVDYLFSLARAAIYTDQRTPNYLSASVDSMSFQRKNSTEDLVGENQQKLERSVLLSKRAQEQQDPEQQENSFLFNSQDQQAISKIRGSTHISSSLGVSQIVRESVESERKSHDKETLVYQVVVEYYTDGTRYEGEKQLNKRHGRGRFFYREGYRYEGNWENGCMSGYGTLWSDQNQKVYEGGWQNNVFHGRGTLYNPEPKIKGDFNGTDFRLLKGAWTKFEGLFQAGQKQGLGTLTMANGDVFVGNFARDVVHGRGSYTPKSSQPFIGLWRQNVLIDKY